MFQTNQHLSLSYPTSTNVGRSHLEFRPRTFRVKRIRDLVTEPLTVSEYLRRPMVRRSRYLLHVVDLERSQYRKVYHRTAKEFWRETPLRVGVFDAGVIIDLLASNWGPTQKDRMALAKFLCRFEQCDFGTYCLGVFSDDLELIG